MLTLDTSTEFGVRVMRRLRDEVIIWLVTVDPDGTPQPSPVWFYWDGQTFLIFSQPNQVKLRNIARNSKVALHLNSDESGGDVAIFVGEAHIAPDAPRADAVPEYVSKYRQHIASIGMTPATFAQSYSVSIRVTPTKLRGH